MSGAAHFSLGVLSNTAESGPGESAGRGVEYILRLGRYSQEQDRLLHAEEGNLPPWAADGADYFKASDDYLIRQNGRLAQNLTFTLPTELDEAERIALIRGFVAEILGEERLPYTWAYHEGYGHNPHVHLLISEAITDDVDRPREQWFRRYNAKRPERGGARKSERFYARKVPDQLRRTWERHANEALEHAGVDVRVSLRSYKDRGIELRPQVKQGRDHGSVFADGRVSMVAAAAEQNLQRVLTNAQRLDDDPSRLLKLFGHQRTITREQLERELVARCLRDEAQPARIRAELDARLTNVGSDRRGNRLVATREQLCHDPELAIRALTLTRSTFTERELADLFGSDDQGQEALAKALGTSALVYAGAEQVGTTADGAPLYQERFTSRELLAAEQRLERNAAALHTSTGPRLNSDAVAKAISTKTLDREGGDEQQRMLQALAGTQGDPAGLVLVQGKPGTGKSYVVGALREAAAASGVRVVGAAIAGKAAAALGADAQIETYTVAKVIRELETGRLDLEGAILVVDEAGMADTRSLDSLLQAARAAGVGRVALIGDTRQLRPVGPGAPFGRLQETYGAIDLSNIQRQSEEWQRAISMRMASGRRTDLKAGISSYTQAGRVREHATRADAYDGVLAAWDTSRREAPNASRLVIAYRLADVDALNSRMRESLRAQGLLGADHTIIDSTGAEHRFAVGDQVLFTHPDDDLKVRNGTLGRVLAIREGRLHVRLDDGRTLALDASQHAPRLVHAFASTVHRAQGATADHVLVYASTNFTAETSFVALTRHRKSVELHYDRQEFAPPTRLTGGVLTARGTPESRLLDRLSRSEREPSATEAVAEGLKGHTTDAEVHVRAYRNAQHTAAREAHLRKLEALADTHLTPADALGHHPAVAAARDEYVTAQRKADEDLRRSRSRLDGLAAATPRSLRFGAQIKFAQRYQAAQSELKATERLGRAAVTHAEETLRHVVAHPDILEAAQDAMALQARRAEEARTALETLRVQGQTLGRADALHDFALAENARLGAPLYRAAMDADRAPDAHHRLLELVKVDQRTIAVLETAAGARLVFPLTEKAAQWLKPGDHVGISAKGAWLEKRNDAWAEAQIRADLAQRGLNATAPRLAADDRAPVTLHHVGNLSEGVRYGLGRNPAGEERLIDLSRHPHGAALQPGDVVQHQAPAQPSGDARAPARSRLERVAVSTDSIEQVAKQLDAYREERTHLAATLTTTREATPMELTQHAPAARIAQLDRDIAVLERDSAAREVAAELRRTQPLVRVAGHGDRGASFVLEREVTRGGQRLAVLAAEDGHSVVVPVTGHDKSLARLEPGKLVTLDREGRQLRSSDTPDVDAMRTEAVRLRVLLEQPRAQLEHVLRAVPAVQAASERLINARTRLQAADRSSEAVGELRAARASYRDAKTAFEGELNRSPALRTLGENQLAERADAWRTARSQLGKLEARLSHPERKALELKVRHSINRARLDGSPLARAMAPSDKRFVWERLETIGSHHVAILRGPDGSRVTRDVSFDHGLRAQAVPGAAVTLAATERGQRLSLDAATPPSALERVVHQLRQERGPTRAWDAADKAKRFLYLGQREGMALLAADDGHTIVRPGAAVANPHLESGSVVAENPRTGALEVHGRSYLDGLRTRAAALRELVAQQPVTLDEAFVHVPSTRAAAEARLAAQARVTRLEAAPGAHTAPELERARTLLREADQELARASTANPGAHQAAVRVRVEQARQWREAKLELARVEQHLEVPARDAAQRLMLYEINRSRPEGKPPVRAMTEGDTGYSFERLERRDDYVFAVLSRSTGERVTTDVTRSPEVRELAVPGMPFDLKRSGAPPTLTPTREPDRAAMQAMRLTTPRFPVRGGRG